jgi:hypothetical protein
MGSSYANLTVVGATTDGVIGALSGQQALVTQPRDGAVGVFPADEENGWPLLGQHLSAALKTAVVGALVYDDDILNVLTWVDGELVDDLCVPDPAQVFGPEMAGMAAEMAEMAEFGDLAEMGIDAAAMGWGPSASPGHDARRLVDLLGRGDAAEVRRVVDGDYVFASERHAELAAALGLPTSVAGWGHHYLTRHGDDFAGGPLISAP